MLKKWIREYIEINKREILQIIFILLLGVIIGAGAYIFASDTVKSLAILNAKEVFDISKSETYVTTNIILNGIKADAILIVTLAIFSVTLFGRYIIYLIMMLKGASVCIYTILLFNIFGPLWGIVVFSLLVLVVNILYIPALIYLTVSFLELNFNLFETRFNAANITGGYTLVFKMIISFIVMFSSIVVEQLVSSVALSIYTKL